MCLTESHCGTDLGLLRTKAEPQADGSYKISGTKIFISAGEHDMADNIVHIVLARLPDAPAGTKGISLFIVPKFKANADGSIGERNAVSCGSLEHKMGIHGNATCVMNFDGATGFLIGPPNKGLNCMFTFMNTARLGTALQGLSHAEIAFQGGLKYARDRLQMRSLTGPKAPEKAADPIIVHPDVRRMLLTTKAFAEGNRAMVYFTAKQVDIVKYGVDEEEKKKADALLAFMTPIAKAFMTEVGFESANHGVQIYGGHGFIAEWGMEQNVRDSRISMLYEGTTGIQALDLLGRKVLMTQGEALKGFTKIVHKFVAIKRSWLLTRSNWWRTFGISLLAAVIAGVISSVITTPVSMLAGFLVPLMFGTEPNPEQAANALLIAQGIAALIGALVGAVTLAFQTGVMALIYVDLRMRRDGFDIELLKETENGQDDGGIPGSPLKTSGHYGALAGFRWRSH